jgi:CRISPR-associated endonuclease/helicase Cas3
MAYAHTPNSQGQWHELTSHLRAVADKARSFAEPFGGTNLAYYAGLWHDLGKFHPAFQQYLSACADGRPPRSVDHKAAGAELALSQHVEAAAFFIQGHHGGLTSEGEFSSWLRQRREDPATSEALHLAKAVLDGLTPTTPPDWLPFSVVRDHLGLDFYLRMVFSALVDADFLDTEAHFSRDRTGLRGPKVALDDLWRRFQEGHAGLTQGREQTPVNAARNTIYCACVAASEQPPGLFRLNVPTGGGKTLSAMAFALSHARQHGMERVIVAVPYISITEQTAEVYRSILDKDGEQGSVVLEHHSFAGLDEPEEDVDFRNAAVQSRLAAENWDAPVVVTTTVQLFQSLFSNKPSRMRKLHHLARSVLILDEAQALPPRLLAPILDAVNRLARDYGATVVLSTATQPAFDVVPGFAGLNGREIVPDHAPLFQTLRRVEYQWRVYPSLAWEQVAELMEGSAQALAVVNTKKDALALLEALDDCDAVHLSTCLTGAHRRQVITEVRRRLESGEPCRLVSTQVVEAGVDIDFPLVLRALGPLDGVIQAAGRCNREGHLDRLGRIIVFQPAEGGLPLDPAYRIGEGNTRLLLQRAGGEFDPGLPEHYQLYSRYFLDTFGPRGTDTAGIQKLRREMDFQKVAAEFKMITDDTVPVIVPNYRPDLVTPLLNQLRVGDRSPRALLRQLQPHIVNIYRSRVLELQRQGLLVEAAPGVIAGVYLWQGDYHPVRGIGGAKGLDPERMVL